MTFHHSNPTVERGVGYIKRSFLEGRTFADLDALNAQLTHWLATVANARVHGTAFMHTTSEYVNGALAAGFALRQLGESSEPTAPPGDPPRLLSLLLERT